MGEETTRLREEIEHTRQDLTRDVDRLAEKTSPSRIVGRRVERTRGHLVGLKEKIMGSSDGPRRTYDPAYTDEPYVDAGPSSGASRLESAKESVTGAASHAAGSAREGLSSAQDAAHGAVATVREQADGNPLAAGVLAFGVGWLVSSLMPASTAETQVAQRATEVAREHGGPVLDQAKQAAGEVGQELKGHAQEAVEQVRDRAQDAAGTVREQARTSATGSG